MADLADRTQQVDEPPIGAPGKAMLALIEGLACPFGLERSVKLGDGDINEDRFLAIVHKDSLGPEPATGLSRIARKLGLPEPLLHLLCGHIAEAEIVHFGYEGGGAGLYKIYLEFPGRVLCGLVPGVLPTTEVVHLAVKWRADDPRSGAVSRYIWPAAARDIAAIGSRLAGLASQAGGLASVQAALAMIEAARRHCPPERIFFMEVEEEGSPRRSFDINFYAAEMSVQAVASVVTRLGAAYSIAPARIQDLLSRIGSLELGHLSGGVGRSGQDFATLYFGVAARKGAAYG